MSDWKLVSECKPPTDDDVLVWPPIEHDGWEYPVSWYGDMRDEWHAPTGNMDIVSPPVYWMPLPEPPKGGGSEHG